MLSNSQLGDASIAVIINWGGLHIFKSHYWISRPFQKRKLEFHWSLQADDTWPQCFNSPNSLDSFHKIINCQYRQRKWPKGIRLVQTMQNSQWDYVSILMFEFQNTNVIDINQCCSKFMWMLELFGVNIMSLLFGDSNLRAWHSLLL